MCIRDRIPIMQDRIRLKSPTHGPKYLSLIHISSDTDGNLTEMELMAVAAPKETINQYKTLFRRAGLRLTLIAPDYSAIRNIIKDYEEVNAVKEPGDYACLLYTSRYQSWSSWVFRQ